MTDLDYFRRGIQEAVGTWVVDVIQASGGRSPTATDFIPRERGKRMQQVRDHLLGELNLMDKGGADEKATQST